jgi:hypothetical protein
MLKKYIFIVDEIVRKVIEAIKKINNQLWMYLCMR